MKKQLKIILIVSSIIIIFLLSLLTIFLLLNNSNSKELKAMEFNFELDSIESDYTKIDDFGKITNNSYAMQGEKFISEKLGLYNISLYSDGTNTTLKYTVKNHDTKKVDKFEYRLMFVDDEGRITNNIILESQEIPSLATYNVTVNISR